MSEFLERLDKAVTEFNEDYPIMFGLFLTILIMVFLISVSFLILSSPWVIVVFILSVITWSCYKIYQRM